MTEAQYNMGIMHANGQGTPKDYVLYYVGGTSQPLRVIKVMKKVEVSSRKK
jgi:hypothetical protein